MREFLQGDAELSRITEQIFKIYKTKKETNWGTFLGFREVTIIQFHIELLTLTEVMLATENLPMLYTVPGVLRWMFRFHDTLGTDLLSHEDFHPILISVFSFYTQ